MYPTLVLVLVSLNTHTSTALVHHGLPPRIIGGLPDTQPNRHHVKTSGQVTSPISTIAIGRFPDEVLHSRSEDSIDSHTAATEGVTEEEKESTGSGLFLENNSVHCLA